MAFGVWLAWLLCLVAEAARGSCPQHCTCSPELDYVDCTGAQLTRIPWDLPDPTGLKQLDLRSNNIKEIITEIVSYSNLEYLDLSYNQILRIDDFVLNSLPKLKYLYLQHNQLDKLSKSTLKNLGALLELDLSHNQFITIDEKVFSDLRSLVRLDLSSNFIHTIDSQAFYGLYSLKSIAINSNRLNNISSDWWMHTTNVNKLLLDMNSISIIEPGAFSLLPQLSSFSLEGNGLQSFSPDAFSPGIPHVEQLSLKQNKFQIVPSDMLTRLHNLLILDMSQNLISVVDPDAFKGLQKLQKLYLNNLPHLEVVRKYSLSELINLHHLEISSNPKLSSIEELAFIGTSELTYVDFHNNALTELSSNLLEWMKLDYVDLRDNAWHCDCKLSYVGELLRYKQNRTDAPYILFQDVRCSTPPNMKGLAIIKMDNTNCKMDPIPPKYGDKIIIAIICMFALCVMLCIFTLVWRTRSIQFNTTEANIPRSQRRRLRRNRASILKEINKQHMEDRMSLPEDIFNNIDDEVFDDNKSVDNLSDNESHKSRKVSFSNYVQVRTCSVNSLDKQQG